MTSSSTLSNEQLVRILDDSLYGLAYKDIERASIIGDAKFAGFILGACFIDAMASFYAGVDKEGSKRGSGKRFKSFVEKYLQNYNAESLWSDLRCGLVHSYAEGGTYVFTDNNKAGSHMDYSPKGKVILNLEDFCADLRKAYKLFIADILTNDDCFLKAKYRYQSMRLMTVKPMKDA